MQQNDSSNKLTPVDILRAPSSVVGLCMLACIALTHTVEHSSGFTSPNSAPSVIWFVFYWIGLGWPLVVYPVALTVALLSRGPATNGVIRSSAKPVLLVAALTVLGLAVNLWFSTRHLTYEFMQGSYMWIVTFVAPVFIYYAPFGAVWAVALFVSGRRQAYERKHHLSGLGKEEIGTH